MRVNVIGAGLAGCEAALYLAKHGIAVRLFEQKPLVYSPAHKSAGFAELVCSNSLKADRLDSASGLLKAEMKLLGDSLLEAAEVCRVAAGGALAVDRDRFSETVTAMVRGQENIEIVNEEVTAIDESEVTIVASGPVSYTHLDVYKRQEVLYD